MGSDEEDVDEDGATTEERRTEEQQFKKREQKQQQQQQQRREAEEVPVGLESLRRVMDDALTAMTTVTTTTTPGTTPKLHRRALHKLSSSIVRELRGGTTSPSRRRDASRRGGRRTRKTTAWSGPSSLSRMQESSSRPMLDPQLKTTVTEQLLRYENCSLTPELKKRMMREMMMLVQGEMAFTEEIRILDESYRTNVTRLRLMWKTRQQSYDTISSVAKRQDAWELDRKRMEEEILMLTSKRDEKLTQLREERIERMESCVQQLSEESLEEEEESLEMGNSLELTPLDINLQEEEENSYLASQEEEEEEEDG